MRRPRSRSVGAEPPPQRVPVQRFGLGWWLTASLLVGGMAAVLALVLVGVMGVGSRSGVGRGGGPVIWGGHGGGFGGGRGGGGFSSGGGGDFGGGGASGSW